MKYKFLKHTQSHRRGHEAEMNPQAVQTKQLLANKIIEPVRPPAENRETKVVAPEETKKPRKRRKAAEVNTDETSADE